MMRNQEKVKSDKSALLIVIVARSFFFLIIYLWFYVRGVIFKGSKCFACGKSETG